MRRNRLARLRIARLASEGDDAGVYLSAGQLFVTGIVVRDNVVEDVEIVDGTLERSGTAVTIGGPPRSVCSRAQVTRAAARTSSTGTASVK